MMSKRIDFTLVQPAAYDAMDALDQLVNRSSVDKVLREFVRIRASQINGCAYCVDAHSADAKKFGESDQRILLISAWREAGDIFSEEERLVLQMTDEITLIHRHGLSDALYEKAIRLFGVKRSFFQKTIWLQQVICTKGVHRIFNGQTNAIREKETCKAGKYLQQDWWKSRMKNYETRKSGNHYIYNIINR